jgi:hypothetical protein
MANAGRTSAAGLVAGARRSQTGASNADVWEWGLIRSRCLRWRKPSHDAERLCGKALANRWRLTGGAGDNATTKGPTGIFADWKSRLSCLAQRVNGARRSSVMECKCPHAVSLGRLSACGVGFAVTGDVCLALGRSVKEVLERYAYKFGGVQLGRKFARRHGVPFAKVGAEGLGFC